MQVIYRFITCLCLIYISLSCKAPQRSAYFQDVPDSTLRMYGLPLTTYSAPSIKSGDILQITIRTSSSSGDGISGSQLVDNAPSDQHPDMGFPVDNEGNIQLPVIGKVKSAGLTTSTLRDTLTMRASRYFKTPVVEVYLANFTVTVLGEVARPGTYTLRKEKVSVLEALGASGDLTIYAKKDNVLLIREADYHKQAVRLNLTSSQSIASEFFYVKQGDIIYVEPNSTRMRIANEGAKTRNYAIAASGLSVLIVLISRLSF